MRKAPAKVGAFTIVTANRKEEIYEYSGTFFKLCHN